MNFTDKISWFRLSVLAASLLLVSTADAQIVELTDPALPGGIRNITYDQGTRLEWLDWSATAGLTFSYVNSQTWHNGKFEGFRLATRSEVKELLEQLGTDVSNWPFGTFVNDSGLSAAMALEVLGQTSLNPQTPHVAAVTADSDSNCNKIVAYLAVNGPCFHSLTQGITIQHPTVSSRHVGFALVRERAGTNMQRCVAPPQVTGPLCAPSPEVVPCVPQARCYRLRRCRSKCLRK